MILLYIWIIELNNQFFQLTNTIHINPSQPNYPFKAERLIKT
jgi:hypothetical protein